MYIGARAVRRGCARRLAFSDLFCNRRHRHLLYNSESCVCRVVGGAGVLACSVSRASRDAGERPRRESLSYTRTKKKSPIVHHFLLHCLSPCVLSTCLINISTSHVSNLCVISDSSDLRAAATSRLLGGVASCVSLAHTSRLQKLSTLQSTPLIPHRTIQQSHPTHPPTHVISHLCTPREDTSPKKQNTPPPTTC